MWHSASRRNVIRVCLLLASVCVVALGARATQVHGYGWEWTLSPSAAPPKIHFEGRDYDRGGKESGGVPPHAVLMGETLGGGQIFKTGSPSGTSTLLYVKDGRSVYVYGLMGGP
jgi:hypothetical protein